MSNFPFHRDKPIEPTNSLEKQQVEELDRVRVVATVSFCLCEHANCIGQYIDSTKTLKVKCGCLCHNNKKNDLIKIEGQVGQVFPDVANHNQVRPTTVADDDIPRSVKHRHGT